MSIVGNLIRLSLGKIQADTTNSPATPADLTKGVMPLNSMIALWVTKEINLGILPVNGIGDDLREPLFSFNAIVSNLALHLADDYEDGQAIVTQTLINNARRDFEDLANVGYREIIVPQIIPSSTLVTGQGNTNNFMRRRNFFGPGRPLGN